ncbi:unnamed protein product [Mytilus coruscus]|uniref:Uncharacterized protein n=1 Tax=Mytilus coruscus TaxID=42192 RepID=A0A6J8EY27_MYTCO|nr:unnamed protein product [Mytilus coruscus]
MRGSDLDIMMVDKEPEVHNVKSSSHQNTRHLTMDTDEVKPGFTQLYSENKRGMFNKIYEPLNGKYYLSSALCRQGFLDDETKYIIHGPCLSDENEMMDIARCLHCKTWMPSATQWITRPSNQWPSHNTKQYNNALRIIVYSISRNTPEKLYRSMDLLDIHYRLLKLKTIQKKSIVQQWKIMLVDDMRFEQNSLLIPYELLKEVVNDMCSIETVPYAYFLKFLCHYYLNNDRQCQNSLQDLRLGRGEICFIDNGGVDISAYHLLGVAIQLIGTPNLHDEHPYNL